jgi:hypothetical protein
MRILPGNKKSKARKAAANNDETPASYPAADRIGWWIAGGAAVTLLVIGLVVMRNRKDKPVTVKRQPVAIPVIPVAKADPLEKARRMLSASNSSIFIKEVESVTWNEVSEQLNIPHVALNQPQVITALQSRGADEATINLFKQLMHDLEYALYIPGQTNEDLQSILHKAERFLNALNALS